jgi:hypothetical protein
VYDGLEGNVECGIISLGGGGYNILAARLLIV